MSDRPDPWALPGPARWLSGIASERADGRSGVVVCPLASSPPGLAEALEAATPRGVRHHALPVPPGEPDGPAHPRPPVAAVAIADRVAESCGIDCPPDPAALARDPRLGRTGFVVDARGAPPAARAGWLAFAAGFAGGVAGLPRATRPTVWVLTRPENGEEPSLPRQDACFAHRWWWGVLGPVDAVVAAADLGLAPDLGAGAAEVARWDLGLLGRLRGWTGDIDRLRSAVIVAAGDGATGGPARSGEAGLGAGTAGGGEAEVEAGIGVGMGVGAGEAADRLPVASATGRRPGPELIGRWAAGTVESWDGLVAVHVSLDLAARADALEQRLWTAQLGRVLPFIELERARLAEWFAAELAEAGAPRGPEFAEVDVAALEIGPLWACVGAHPQVRVGPERLALLRDLRAARNALAHRQPLTHDRVVELRRRAAADRRP